MNFTQKKFSLIFMLFFSLSLLAQEANNETKLLQDINSILSNSIAATTYTISISNDDLITNCGFKQTFPLNKIDIEKIKIKKESMQINNQGRKGNLYYLKLFSNEKGNHVVNDSFPGKVNMLLITFSHEQPEAVQKLKDLLIELVKNHIYRK